MTHISETDEVDVIELIQNLWGRKLVVLGVSAAAVAVICTQVALTPKSFNASIVVRLLDAATIGGHASVKWGGIPRDPI